MPVCKKINIRETAYSHLSNGLSSRQTKAKSLPAVKPYAVSLSSGNSAPIQMYREEKGYNISENNQFAVFDEGKPESKMYATTEAEPAKLKEEVVSFNMVDTSDYPKEYGMKEVVPNKKMSPERIKEIHCGTFSREATGKMEEVENENAPKGRSLFVKDFQWSEPQGLKKENPSRGTWENHYAPVIVQDGSDRGTFETAVHIDHAYFGIYGSKKGQTFRLKTVLADIELSVKRGLLDPEIAKQLKTGIQNYIKNDPSGTDDEYLQKEIKKIDQLSNSNPDIDKPFKEREEQDRERKKKTDEFWLMVSTGEEEDSWKYMKEQDNLRYSLIYLNDFNTKAKKEENAKAEKKIQALIQRVKKEMDAESGSKNDSGIGWGPLIGGAAVVIGAIAWGIIAYLKKKNNVSK